jgi:hypothetical protein
MHHHYHLGELALLGAVAFGAYELYHLERYGNFGIGDPNHHGIVFGGNNAPYDSFGGYSAPYGSLGGPTSVHHHRHHHIL